MTSYVKGGDCCLKCIRCKKDFELTEKMRKKRIESNVNENICPGCFFVISRYYKNRLAENALYFGPKENPFSWDIFVENREALTNCTKLYVKVRCHVCGKEDIRRIDKVINSKYASDVQVCNNCVVKYVVKLC